MSDYTLHPDYLSLTERVRKEIHSRKRDAPDSSFSTEYTMIDDLISHEEIERYDPEIVLRIAAEHGLEIKVCRYGSQYANHSRPKVRANGKWLDMPKDIEPEFKRGGSYLHLEDVTMCPDCAQTSIDQVQMMKRMGARGITRFSAFSQLLSQYSWTESRP